MLQTEETTEVNIPLETTDITPDDVEGGVTSNEVVVQHSTCLKKGLAVLKVLLVGIILLSALLPFLLGGTSLEALESSTNIIKKVSTALAASLQETSWHLLNQTLSKN